MCLSDLHVLLESRLLRVCPASVGLHRKENVFEVLLVTIKNTFSVSLMPLTFSFMCLCDTDSYNVYLYILDCFFFFFSMGN